MRYLWNKDPDIEIIKLLIESGVDVNKNGKNQATSLYILFLNAQNIQNLEEIMRLLVQHTNDDM